MTFFKNVNWKMSPYPFHLTSFQIERFGFDHYDFTRRHWVDLHQVHSFGQGKENIHVCHSTSSKHDQTVFLLNLWKHNIWNNVFLVKINYPKPIPQHFKEIKNSTKQKLLQNFRDDENKTTHRIVRNSMLAKFNYY